MKSEGDLENLKIDQSLIQYMRNAHSFYTENLKKKREEDENKVNESTAKKQKLQEIKQLEAERLSFLERVSDINEKPDLARKEV